MIRKAKTFDERCSKLVQNLCDNINALYEKIKIFADLEDVDEIKKKYELLCKYSDVILKDLESLKKYFY